MRASATYSGVRAPLVRRGARRGLPLRTTPWRGLQRGAPIATRGAEPTAMGVTAGNEADFITLTNTRAAGRADWDESTFLASDWSELTI